MTWANVSVTKYQELLELYQNSGNLSKEELDLQILSLLTDTSVDDIENLSIPEYNELIASIRFSYTPPTNIPQKKIQTKAAELHLIEDLYGISIGEYIDLEHFFADGYVKNLPTICSILYRQKENTNPGLYKDRYEDYGNWIYIRADLFRDLPIMAVYGVIPKYLAFKTEFEETFSNLLGSNSSDSTTDEDDIVSRSERMKEEEENDNRNKFGWDFFLLRLAKLNNCTFQEATNIPLVQAFGMISMAQAFKLPI